MSAQRFGQIHPVIEGPDGEVLSGEHRLRADPSWRRERRDDLKTPLDKIGFKLAANIQRRVDDRERRTLLRAAFKHYSRNNPRAEMGAFAEALGVTPQFVSRYIGDLFSGQRPNGVLRLPEGTVLTSERQRGDTVEETLAKVTSIGLRIHSSTSHLYLDLPKVLVLKYELEGGDRLIADCKNNRFIVFKPESGDS